MWLVGLAAVVWPFGIAVTYFLHRPTSIEFRNTWDVVGKQTYDRKKDTQWKALGRFFCWVWPVVLVVDIARLLYLVLKAYITSNTARVAFGKADRAV